MFKKIIAITSIVLAIAIIFCGGYFVRDIGLKTATKEKDTKKAADTEKVKIDDSFVYDWLLKNGELVDNMYLTYSIKKEDGSLLTITTTTAKTISIEYTFVENNYKITCETNMFGEGEQSFSCTMLDENSIGKENLYSFKKSSFTRNTPLSKKEHVCWYIDGDSISSFTFKGDKYVYRTYSSANGGSFVDEEIPKEKIKKAHNIEEIITESAHKYLCTMLGVMETDLCPLLEIDMKDLGYDKF